MVFEPEVVAIEIMLGELDLLISNLLDQVIQLEKFLEEAMNDDHKSD